MQDLFRFWLVRNTRVFGGSKVKKWRTRDDTLEERVRMRDTAVIGTHRYSPISTCCMLAVRNKVLLTLYSRIIVPSPTAAQIPVSPTIISQTPYALISVHWVRRVVFPIEAAIVAICFPVNKMGFSVVLPTPPLGFPHKSLGTASVTYPMQPMLPAEISSSTDLTSGLPTTTLQTPPRRW